ncbi:MAG: phospholipase D-like domain-containing protein [Nocardioides sp.]
MTSGLLTTLKLFLNGSSRSRGPRRWAHLALALTIASAGLLVASEASAAPVRAQGRLTAAAESSSTWRPTPGVVFNQPRGTSKQRTALIRRVKAGIKHAPKGSYIRFAMYSFDRRDVANALIKAHKRGVRVQLIVNDNWTSSQTRRLRRELGTNRWKKNFMIICKGSCRGGMGNIHMKVYSFSQTGAATKVLMTGSGNLTDRAVNLQWNDQHTFVDRPEFFDLFVKVFNQLKRDRRASPRRLAYGESDFDALFYKDLQAWDSAFGRVRPAGDPVYQRLSRVDCQAPAGYGVNGHTSIRITMYGWNRYRGMYLAKKVGALKRQGCDIKVILSVPWDKVIAVLRSNHIPMKSADYDINLELEEGKRVNFYSHLKVMALSGTYSGQPTTSVWTGSENWSPVSFRNDELIIHTTAPTVYAKYLEHFNFMWASYTHAMGVRPPGLP